MNFLFILLYLSMNSLFKNDRKHHACSSQSRMTGLKIKKRKEKEKKRVSQALFPEGEVVPGGTGNASTELQAELELGKI